MVEMLALAPIGRIFFAIALVAFGIQQFLFGDFVPGRAPAWPVGVPGRLAWAWSSGLLFIATGGTLLWTGVTPAPRVRRAAWLLTGMTGAIIAVWALLRHVPLILQDGQFGSAWTMFGKALTFSTGALAVAASLRGLDGQAGASRALHRMDELGPTLGRIGLGSFMAAAGIQHFLWEEFVQTLVPAWIPGPLFWTYFAGVALIAAGVGLIVPATSRLAGTMAGLMVFSWVVLLHVPRAVAAAEAASSRNEWVAVFEALAVSGLAVVLASAPARRQAPAPQALHQ